MAFDENSFVFGVKDCKIAKLLTDASGAPTYDTSIDVPGIKGVTATLQVEEKVLEGDEAVIDRRTQIKSVEFAVENGVIPLAACAVIFGGTSVVSGTTPNKKAEYKLQGADRPDYFKLEAQATECDEVAGDGHVIGYKCKLSGNPKIALKGGDYAEVSFSCTAIPCVSNDDFFELEFNETAVAIT